MLCSCRIYKKSKGRRCQGSLGGWTTVTFPSRVSFCSVNLKVYFLAVCFMVVRFCPQFSISSRNQGQGKVSVLLIRKQDIFLKSPPANLLNAFFTRNQSDGHPQSRECGIETLWLFRFHNGKRKRRRR